MSLISKELKRLIQKDSQYQLYLGILESMYFDCDAAYKEVTTLHEKRKSRKLYRRKSLTPNRVTTTSLQDQSYRSRVIELIVQATYCSKNLSAAHEALLDYLAVTYGADTGVRAKAERRIVFESIPKIREGSDIINTITTFLEVANWIQDDIDQASWNLRSAMKGLEIGAKREVSI